MKIANRMHHFALGVKNLDESVRWYEEKLDFKVERRFGFPEAGTEIAHLLCDGLRLELLAREGSVAGPDVGRDPFEALLTEGAKHIGFLVDDIQEAAAELQRRGVELVAPPTVVEPAGVANLWIRDPSGTLIEIAQHLHPESASSNK